MHRTLYGLFALVVSVVPWLPAQAHAQQAPIDPANYDQLRIGDGDGRRIVVPTNQVLAPAGRQRFVRR